MLDGDPMGPQWGRLAARGRAEGAGPDRVFMGAGAFCEPCGARHSFCSSQPPQPSQPCSKPKMRRGSPGDTGERRGWALPVPGSRLPPPPAEHRGGGGGGQRWIPGWGRDWLPGDLSRKSPFQAGVPWLGQGRLLAGLPPSPREITVCGHRAGVGCGHPGSPQPRGAPSPASSPLAASSLRSSLSPGSTCLGTEHRLQVGDAARGPAQPHPGAGRVLGIHPLAGLLSRSTTEGTHTPCRPEGCSVRAGGTRPRRLPGRCAPVPGTGLVTSGRWGGALLCARGGQGRVSGQGTSSG